MRLSGTLWQRARCAVGGGQRGESWEKTDSELRKWGGGVGGYLAAGLLEGLETIPLLGIDDRWAEGVLKRPWTYSC